MFSRSKRRRSTTEGLGLARVENPSKLVRCGKSPELKQQNPDLIEAIKLIEAKDVKGAVSLIQHIEDEKLTKTEKNLRDLLKLYTTNPSDRTNSFELIDKYLERNPFSFSFRYTRAILDKRPVKSFFPKLEDCIYLNCLSETFPQEGLMDMTQNLETVMHAERIVRQDFLAKYMDREPTSKAREDEIIDSVKESLRYLLTTPLGVVRSKLLWSRFTEKNKTYFRNVKDQAEREKLRTPPTTGANKTPRQSAPSIPKKKIQRSLIGRRLSTSSSGSESPPEPPQHHSVQDEPLNKDECEDFFKQHFEDKGLSQEAVNAMINNFAVVEIPQDMRQRFNQDDEEFCEIITRRANANQLPEIDLVGLMGQTIHFETILDYGTVYQSDKTFYQRMTLLHKKILSFSKLSDFQNEVQVLKSSTNRAFQIVGFLLEARVELVSGNLAKADSVLMESIQKLGTYTTENRFMKQLLQNSVHLMKAAVKLAQRRFPDCFKYLQIVLENEPANPDAHFLLVMMLIDNGDYNEALGYVEKSQFVLGTFYDDPVKELFQLIRLSLRFPAPAMDNMNYENEVNQNTVRAFCNIADSMKDKPCSVPYSLFFCSLLYKLSTVTGFDSKQKKTVNEFFRKKLIRSTMNGSLAQVKQRLFRHLYYHTLKGCQHPEINLGWIMTNPDIIATPSSYAELDSVHKALIKDRSWSYMFQRFGHSWIYADWMRITRQHFESVLNTQA